MLCSDLKTDLNSINAVIKKIHINYYNIRIYISKFLAFSLFMVGTCETFKTIHKTFIFKTVSDLIEYMYY